MNRFFIILLVLLLAGMVSFSAPGQVAPLSAADSLLGVLKDRLCDASDANQPDTIAALQAQIEALREAVSEPALADYYSGLADYLVIRCCGDQLPREAKEQLLDHGIGRLNQSIDLKRDFADAFALLSNLYGQKIGLEPWRGLYLGPRVGIAQDLAAARDPDNPRVHFFRGLNALYGPEIFSGGMAQARKSFEKALELFAAPEKSDNPLYPRWGEADTWSWLGIIALRTDSLDQAEYYFDKALEINPGLRNIRERILPELQRRRDKLPAKN